MIDFLMDNEQRHKTLRELRAEALAREGYGIRCPKCGAAHLPQQNHGVERTKALGPQQSIRRIRECRACGNIFQTKEIVVGKVQ